MWYYYYSNSVCSSMYYASATTLFPAPLNMHKLVHVSHLMYRSHAYFPLSINRSTIHFTQLTALSINILRSSSSYVYIHLTTAKKIRINRTYLRCIHQKLDFFQGFLSLGKGKNEMSFGKTPEEYLYVSMLDKEVFGCGASFRAKVLSPSNSL
jgi:hypothetical protein